MATLPFWVTEETLLAWAVARQQSQRWAERMVADMLLRYEAERRAFCDKAHYWMCVRTVRQ